jgi:Flp pilus assembly protein TadB
MGSRGLLVALIVAATAAFVVGTAIERNGNGESAHNEATTTAAPVAKAAGASETQSEAGGESPAAHADETAKAPTGREPSHAELRPLGIDIEAWPFVALAALASLTLALTAWLHPQLVPLLALVAVTMLAFAALDVREVVHQFDINKDGLAILAAVIAGLHGGAALVAATLASRAWHPDAGSHGTAGTMAA